MRTVNRWSSAGLAVAAALLIAPATARADTLPFNDPNAQGTIGLCDSSGGSIRTGSSLAHPFVVMAASSIPAPAGYTIRNRAKATLYAFQPRQDVDPAEWSGMQLTGSSIYVDADHPMVAGTNLDYSMKDVLAALPAKWDGLIQLRIYYTAPNQVPFRSNYPTAVLRVNPSTWSVVQGGDVPCDSRKVISNERLVLPASAFNKKPGGTGSPTAAPGTSSTAAAGSSSSGAAAHPTTGAAASGLASGSDSASAAEAQHAGQGVPLVAWLVAAATVLAAASGGWLWWRRRAT